MVKGRYAILSKDVYEIKLSGKFKYYVKVDAYEADEALDKAYDLFYQDYEMLDCDIDDVWITNIYRGGKVHEL